MSLATERPAKLRALRRGPCPPPLDGLNSVGFQDTVRGKGRGTSSERSRGRSLKKQYPEVSLSSSSYLQPQDSKSLLKDHPQTLSRLNTARGSETIKRTTSELKVKATSILPPSSTSSSARSRSPHHKPSDHSTSQTKQMSPNNHAHARTRRGRRLKNKDSSNLKPLSLEDAFASLKCNPFDGEPLKTPLVLTPLPHVNSLSKLPSSPKEVTKQADLKENEGQLLTIPTLGTSTSRPVTPITHIDWADDDDDDSLPDLDDWVTSSTAVVLSDPIEEKKLDIPNEAPALEANVLTPLQSTIELETRMFHSDTKIEEASTTAGAEILKPNGQIAQSVDEENQAVLFDHLHKESTVPIVKLPGAGDTTVLVEDDKPSKLEVEAEAAPGDNQSRPRPSHRRPNSMTPPIPSNRNSYAAQFDRMHSRAHSLPHNNRGLQSQSRTRPVISAAGLTRISRTLAQAGVNSIPVSKVACSPATTER